MLTKENENKKMYLSKKIESHGKNVIFFEFELLYNENSKKELFLYYFDKSKGDTGIYPVECMISPESLINYPDYMENPTIKGINRKIYQLHLNSAIDKDTSQVNSIKSTEELIKNLADVISGNYENQLNKTNSEKLQNKIKELKKKVPNNNSTMNTEIDSKTHLRKLDYEEKISLQELLKKYLDNPIFLSNIIKWFYDEKFNKETLYELFTSNDNLTKESKSLIDEVYNDDERFTGQNLVRRATLDDKDYDLLFNIINLSKLNYTRITHTISDDTSFVSDPKKCKVLKEKANENNKGIDIFHSTIIESIPIEIIKYENKILSEEPTFRIKWKSRKSTFYTPVADIGVNLKDIQDILLNRGEIVNKYESSNAISSLVKEFEYRDLMIVKTDIQKPGFYYDEDNDEINIVKYELNQPSNEELLKGVEVLDSLKLFFDGQLDKLATILKWGWISPFFYCMKQKGNQSVSYLSLSGVAGTGKTTIGRIALYLWNHPIDGINDISGAKAGSVARLGDIINHETFPTIINESSDMFNEKNMRELIKSGAYGLVARARYEGNNLKTFLALSPLIFTQNGYLPEDDGIIRRFYELRYNLSEQKTKEEKKAFEKAFEINKPKISKLNHLKSISHFIANEIISAPELLDLDCDELAVTLLHRLYFDLNLDFPEWLNLLVENYDLNEMYNIQDETIRSFLVDNINRTHTERVKDASYTSDGLDLYLDMDLDDGINLRVDTILTKQLISWMILKKTRYGDMKVCLTTEFPKQLKEKTGIDYHLSTLAQIMGFKYGTQNFGKKEGSDKSNRKRVMYTSLENFKNYLFPTEVFEEV
ncbi:MAG: hypothetical protein K1X33_08780 [Methanobacteriaceae archaeon]|nr:hypothetical protein [Methanobacteriaceae archaeon]